MDKNPLLRSSRLSYENGKIIKNMLTLNVQPKNFARIFLSQFIQFRF